VEFPIDANEFRIMALRKQQGTKNSKVVTEREASQPAIGVVGRSELHPHIRGGKGLLLHGFSATLRSLPPATL
jgi:hypothetical protein